ncbi:MAG: HDOD domain-containing protein [Succinivibrionaceae bacterium]|nr:HDOD domain-containing protein [Succinivibrionaceae bacterium]
MQDIGATIRDKLRTGKISLPSLPDNAVKLRNLASDPKSTLNDLAVLIGHDASVSAQLIRLAQTMRYSHPGCTITSLHMAINRIGMNGTVNLVLAMSILQGYSFHSKLLHAMCRQDYETSRRISRYSLTAYQLINGDLPMQVGDYISLASIFLNIGFLPIYSELDAIERVTQVQFSSEMVYQWKDTLRSILGRMILEKWKFDQKFVDVVSLNITDNYTPDMKAVVYGYDFVKNALPADLVPLGDDLSDSFSPLEEGRYRSALLEYLQGRNLV